MTVDLTDILTVAEAAQWMNISRAAIYQAIADKRLKAHSILGRIIIPKEAVIAYNRNRRTSKRKAV